MASREESLGAHTCISRYQFLKLIGEGSFSEVYLALDTKDGERVAIKKLKPDLYRRVSDSHPLPQIATREITILKKLQHENVISLKDVIISPDDVIHLIFEKMECDLDVLAERRDLNPFEIKEYMRQVFNALEYCEANDVLHRDIKGKNILWKDGIIKLADFGSAREETEDDVDLIITSYASEETRQMLQAYLDDFTADLVTLRYRPPEMLLGKTYSSKVDVWSGVVFAKLLNRSHIFNGVDPSDQINQIFQLCGSPDDKIPRRTFKRTILRALGSQRFGSLGQDLGS